MYRLTKIALAILGLAIGQSQWASVYGYAENWLVSFQERSVVTYRGSTTTTRRIYNDYTGTNATHYTKSAYADGTTYISYEPFSAYYSYYCSVWQPDSQTRYELSRSGYDRVMNFSLINTHYVRHIAVGNLYDTAGRLLQYNGYNVTQSWWMRPETSTYAIDSSGNYTVNSILLQQNVWP